MKNNPYIELVRADNDIFHVPENIYTYRGKWIKYFGNSHPIVLEIGTGMGNFFGKLVGENPNKNFIGMEIRYKRLYQSAEKARKGHNNNFVMLKDFAQNIDKIFTPNEISETYIFFPDPWANKERQRKNRVLQEDFLQKLYSVTQKGGKLFFKTDHREYFDATQEIVKTLGLWKIQNWTHNYEESEIFNMDNITEFEALYRGKKTEIHYMELKKL